MKIKNIFEPIAKPFKFVDKEILRWYTKKAKKLEEKRYDINKINLGLSGIYVPLGLTQITFAGYSFPSFHYWGFPFSALEGNLVGRDIGRNLTEKEEIISDTATENYENYNNKKITNLSRLPALVWGIANTGKGIYDVGRYVATGESPNWSETAFNLSTGIEHLALASSIYFKARDPKLLDKAPAWKNIYEKTKEKLKEYAPQPVPEPSPIKVNYLLEEKLKWN